jgi:hypothetical protein
VGRRSATLVRRQEAVCRSHERAVHEVPGLSRVVIAGIAEAEHDRLTPGTVARQLRRWAELAARGSVYRPASHPCGEPECCGPAPRGVLEEAICCLQERGRPALRQAVSRIDEVHLRNTLADPLADPAEPWWERRRPAGWPRAG